MDEKIKNIIRENNVDALLVTNNFDITYVSKFMGKEAYALLTNFNKYLLSDRRYVEQAKLQCPDFTVVLYENKTDLMKTIVYILNIEKVKRLGLDISDIKHEFYLDIKNLNINMKVINLRNPFMESRAIKSPFEIQKITTACEIADRTFYRLLQIITDGMSEKDIEIELNYLIKREGGDGYAFDPIIGTEEKTSMPYSSPEKNVFIRKGNFILLNYGVNFEGYTSAIARMVALGNIREEYKKINLTVFNVYTKIIDSIRPNMEYEELYNIFEQEIENSEYKKYFLKAIAHGRGLQSTEGYILEPNVKRKIMSNEVYSFGVSISIPKLGGARLEDVVLIKENSIELLTNSVRNLLNI